MTIGVNLYIGWCGILAGIVAGALLGLFFSREDWLGGYGSWRRRLVRLAHVSFFGLGLINIAFALSVQALGLRGDSAPLRTASASLGLGAAAMPVVCYLAAWRPPFRHLFVFPVACVLLGVAVFVREGFLR